MRLMAAQRVDGQARRHAIVLWLVGQAVARVLFFSGRQMAGCSLRGLSDCCNTYGVPGTYSLGTNPVRCALAAPCNNE